MVSSGISIAFAFVRGAVVGLRLRVLAFIRGEPALAEEDDEDDEDDEEDVIAG
jgi:hypothetical protein